MSWPTTLLLALAAGCAPDPGADGTGDALPRDDTGTATTDGGAADGGSEAALTCMDCHGSEGTLQETVDEDTGSPVQSDSGEG